MFLEQWIERVEGKVLELGRGLWQGPPKTDLEAQIHTLEEERRCNEAARAELEQQAEQLRGQLSNWRDRIDPLVHKVAAFVRAGNEAAAWPDVLELDELRRQQTEAKPRLPRLEQAAWSLQFRNRQIERQLEDLRRELETQRETRNRPRRRPRR